jgi:hypothetical protein
MSTAKQSECQEVKVSVASGAMLETDIFLQK